MSGTLNTTTTPPPSPGSGPPPPSPPAAAPTASTITERGWDGWPTPPTPGYLIPAMGKIPVSSTVHFQTVVMTEMGDEITAAQLKTLRASMLAAAISQPTRIWDLDEVGHVTVTTVPVPDPPPFQPPAAETDTLVQSLHNQTPLFSDFQSQWRIRASPADTRALQPFQQDLTQKQNAAATDKSPAAQAALIDAERALIMEMGRLSFERGWRDNRNNTHLADVHTYLAKLFQPRPTDWTELIARLEAAHVTAQDINAASPPENTVEDALNALFNLFDESRLDPFSAIPDAMETPATGVILYQEQGWYARGLALGNLLHSVALAPGEVTQIAITNWSHAATSTDNELSSQSDSTTEFDVQNRAATDVQTGAVQEHSSGGSTAASASASEQAGYSGFGVSASVGASQNVSTAVSYSDGSRNLSMMANQRVDAVTQRQAEAARTKRAAVIREQRQTENQDLTTRVVANYNHMHALTVMYFEVVEAYDLKTRVVDAERIIFLPYQTHDVVDLIPRFRAVLIAAAQAAGLSALAEAIKYYKLGDAAVAGVLGGLDAELEKLGGPKPPAGAAGNTPAGKIAALAATLDETKKSLDAQKAEFAKKRADLQSGINAMQQASTTMLAQIKDHPELAPLSNTAQAFQTSAAQFNAQLLANNADEESTLTRLRAQRDRLQKELDTLNVEADRLEEARRLLESADAFNSYRLFFNQAVWLSLSPGEVLSLARRRHLFRGESICQLIDPAPVAITGNYVAYRWRFADPVADQQFKKQFVEPFTGDPDQQLRTVHSTIALPTGGLFGEAVLGEGVSAEKLDLSRFWNWKDSMIPILPTGINALTAATPTMQNLGADPTKLDESSAKLGALQDLPAPAGIAAMAETLRTQSFRDMSMQTMLQSLAEATTKAASSGSQEAAKLASDNYKAGLEFAKEMAPMVLEAMAAPETGGASLLAGKLNAAEGGGTSLLGGMLNAKGIGSASDVLSILSGGKSGASKGPHFPAVPTQEPGDDLPGFPAVPTQEPGDELENVD